MDSDNKDEDEIVETNDSGRPRRECIGQGVSILQMSMNRNKQYVDKKEINTSSL